VVIVVKNIYRMACAELKDSICTHPIVSVFRSSCSRHSVGVRTKRNCLQSNNHTVFQSPDKATHTTPALNVVRRRCVELRNDWCCGGCRRLTSPVKVHWRKNRMQSLHRQQYELCLLQREDTKARHGPAEKNCRGRFRLS
jgi:hypothetical protein